MTFDETEEALSRFRVSKELGFLTRCDMSKMHEYYRPWIDLCANMVELIRNNRVQQAVVQLPLLTTDKLVTYEDWRTAHLLLVTMASGYLWSADSKEAPLVLPRSISIPLTAVSDQLGIRPVICHASACLANWHLIDSNQPFSPDNLQLNAFTFLNSRGNHWFFVVTAQHQLISKTVNRDVDSDREGLCPMYIREILKIHLLIGMEDRGHFKYGGGSAAQSSTIQLVDAFLKVEHTGLDQRNRKIIPTKISH
ncbi:hypothetical protein ANCDUO_00291 [Ancylostoma duodenale]|uniref:Indoleamine 2,3-dioxygenase n=1 Tax=Ancylostoma duodenale TaxID=51022 RepID=A0A0C2DHF6_9BILA|nr:hypothetical protein ANCDUO_00291 [Ancylostoma duodenale]